MTTRAKTSKDKSKQITEFLVQNENQAVKGSSSKNQEAEVVSKFWGSKQEFLADMKNVVRSVFEEEFSSKLEEYDDAIQRIDDDIEETKETQKTFNEDIQAQVTELRTSLGKQIDENKRLKSRIVSLESSQKSNNLRFDGLKEQRWEICEETVLEFLSSIGIGLPYKAIIQAKRIGNYVPGSKYPRTMLVSFLHIKDKMAILGQRHLVKSQCNITIREDFPPEIMESRKIMSRIYNATKEYHKAKLEGEIL